MMLSQEAFLARIQPKAGRPIPMVLDTDTYNEVDDQFCLAYSLLSGGFDVKAVFAAPFFNSRSSGPADGMERSYQEILKLLDLMQLPQDPPVFRGSTAYMTQPDVPVDSPAARELIRLALAQPVDDPLYVVTIGCPVNVSSAILMEPEIINHIVLVWLGGNPSYWDTACEFNLMQDPMASAVMMDCGAPLVMFPCQQVTDHLTTTLPELAYYLEDSSPLGQYLYRFVADYAAEFHAGMAWSKVIWDPITVLWMLHPEALKTQLVHTPALSYVPGEASTSENLKWLPRPDAPWMLEIINVNRDVLFADLFRLLGTKR